jgi:hypothetical protein
MPRPKPTGTPNQGPSTLASSIMFPGISRNPVVIAAAPRPAFRAAVYSPAIAVAGARASRAVASTLVRIHSDLMSIRIINLHKFL